MASSIRHYPVRGSFFGSFSIVGVNYDFYYEKIVCKIIIFLFPTMTW